MKTAVEVDPMKSRHVPCYSLTLAHVYTHHDQRATGRASADEMKALTECEREEAVEEFDASSPRSIQLANLHFVAKNISSRISPPINDIHC